MGSRPRQADVDGLVSDGRTDGRICVGQTDRQTDGQMGGLDVISINIDKTMGKGAGSGTGASGWVGYLANRWWRVMAAPGGW